MEVFLNFYLVMGDNCNYSYDGWCWGFVFYENIIGWVIFCFWFFISFGIIDELLLYE